MTRKFLKYSSGICMAICLCFSACVKMDIVPYDKFTDVTYWTSEDKANSVLNMAYRQMASPGRILGNEILTDNVYNAYGTTNEKIIASGLADASNGRFSSEWNDAYSGIKTCHLFLENVDRVTAMPEDLRNKRKAEARFIRAWHYLNLTNWFGDVPHFVKDIDYEESKKLVRKPKAEIMAWIHQELDEIAEILPSKQAYSAADNGRITSGAAVALNARAYLWENNWEKVAEYAGKLINSTKYGSYSLFNNYEQLFWARNEYNSEIILDIQFVPDLRTWSDLQDLVPMSAGARLNLAGPTQELVNSYLMKNGQKWTSADPDYANRDPRLNATIAYDGSKWIDRSGNEYSIVIHPDGIVPNGKVSDKFTAVGTAQTSTGYYYRKYADPSASTYPGSGGWASSLNFPLIRYADVLLMYAEAKNELGLMDATVWNQTIKLLRQRAGFDNVPAAMDLPSSDKNQLREIVRNERRVELALEGLRIYDIRRWKIAQDVLNVEHHGAKFDKSSGTYDYIKLPALNFSKDRDYLWAIPRKELLADPNLTQNPGY